MTKNIKIKYTLLNLINILWLFITGACVIITYRPFHNEMFWAKIFKNDS